MFDTATKTLGVNVAFLSEIKEDHFELRELLGKTERAFEQPPRRRKPRELIYLLLALQDRLAMHFALEEAYGYCEDALEVAPWLSSQAEALRAEHSALYKDFCNLVDDAEQLLAPIPIRADSRHQMNVSHVEIASRYGRFREAFDEHERREMELVLAAFVDDVGVGD